VKPGESFQGVHEERPLTLSNPSLTVCLAGLTERHPEKPLRIVLHGFDVGPLVLFVAAEGDDILKEDTISRVQWRRWGRVLCPLFNLLGKLPAFLSSVLLREEFLPRDISNNPIPLLRSPPILSPGEKPAVLKFFMGRVELLFDE
jgi:hypothetical protein